MNLTKRINTQHISIPQDLASITTLSTVLVCTIIGVGAKRESTYQVPASEKTPQ